MKHHKLLSQKKLEKNKKQKQNFAPKSLKKAIFRSLRLPYAVWRLLPGLLWPVAANFHRGVRGFLPPSESCRDFRRLTRHCCKLPHPGSRPEGFGKQMDFRPISVGHLKQIDKKIDIGCFRTLPGTFATKGVFLDSQY